MNVNWKVDIHDATVDGERLRPAGNGTRDVFIGKDIVLKLNDDNDLSQNKREAQKLRMVMASPDAAHFPRLLGHSDDYGWIVVSRIKPLRTGRISPKHKAEVDRLCKKFRIGDVSHFTSLGDGMGWNCGVSNGRVVIFDLGCTP